MSRYRDYVQLILTTTSKVNILHQAPEHLGISIGDLIESENGEAYTVDKVLEIEKDCEELNFLLKATGYETLDNVPKAVKLYFMRKISWEEVD